MITTKNIYEWLLCSLLLSGLLLFVACSQDSGSDQPQTGNLRLSSVTRASNERLTPSDGSSIYLFVTTPDNVFSQGTFTYSTSWTNTGIKVGEHTQYYIYGYMPKNDTYISSIAQPDGSDYSTGADLTLSNLPVFTSEDICVTVGVRRITEDTDYTAATEGNFGYLSGLTADNWINLLMDHIYCDLILKFKVDADYNDLRLIKLKSVKLQCTYGDKIQAKVLLRSGSDLGEASIVYSKYGSGTSTDHYFLETTDPLVELDATTKELGSIYCPPIIFDYAGTNMNLVCTYDVYDRDNHLMRANCTAVNSFRLSHIQHGEKTTVTVTVAPTYLYMLGDYDLDSPTIIVN